MDTPPVFVIGTPRSGTTLTAKILGRHPSLFMPGETHFFDDIYSRRVELGTPDSVQGSQNIASRLYSLYGRFNEPDDQKRIESITTEEKLSLDIREQCSSYEDVFSFFMDIQRNASKKECWGNNTPRDLFNVREIKEFYPEAKIIVCIRDPKDFLGSYKGKWRSTAPDEVNRLKSLYHPVITSYLWKANMKQLSVLNRMFSQDNIITIKYEELVSTPAIAVNKMCEHIGIKYNIEMLNINFSNSSSGSEVENKIFTSSVGNWTNRISNEEAWISQFICSPASLDLGYKNEKLSVSTLKLISYALSSPIALYKAMQANKHKRGPLVPYLFKRLFSN